jgi:hypothetical protein
MSELSDPENPPYEETIDKRPLRKATQLPSAKSRHARGFERYNGSDEYGVAPNPPAKGFASDAETAQDSLPPSSQDQVTPDVESVPVEALDEAPGADEGTMAASDETAQANGGEPAAAPSEKEPSATSTQPTDEANHDVLDANVGDQPTGEDSLGFQPYVQAIASFLKNEVTKPPLTLSIEGEWGSGKSSFMLQLKKELSKETVISFNAWQYDKDDAMWAAFALESARQLSGQLPFRQRWLAHLELFFRRFKWDQGWMDMAKLALMLGAVLVALALPILALDQVKAFALNSALRKVVGASGALAYLSLVVGLLLKAKDVVGNPLTINLKQHLDTPDYKTRVAFIQRFHEDFARVIKVYGRNEKVYVFIDDLDRCEVPKAADLMQALNLMISDSNRLIFIMGLDREKVAAGLAVKYEKLLPYLAPAPASNGTRTTATFDPVLGLEYGYSFIEKFIQLPFLVPQASNTQLAEFLRKIFGSNDSSSPVSQSPVQPQATIAAGMKAEKAVTENSAMVTEILEMVAPAFDYNPRRLKQFINAFRLKTFIASRTGLFAEPDESSFYTRLTPQQLGKFVAISLRWPLLLADLDNERDLLSRLQYMVLRGLRREDLYTIEGGLKKVLTYQNAGALVVTEELTVTEALARWCQRENLRRLLGLRVLSRDGGRVDYPTEKIYSLDRMDVNKLLQVSPLTRPVPATTTSNPSNFTVYGFKGAGPDVRHLTLL